MSTSLEIWAWSSEGTLLGSLPVQMTWSLGRAMISIGQTCETPGMLERSPRGSWPTCEASKWYDAPVKMSLSMVTLGVAFSCLDCRSEVKLDGSCMNLSSVGMIYIWGNAPDCSKTRGDMHLGRNAWNSVLELWRSLIPPAR